jgi:DNA-binding protein H-NS
MTKVSLSELLAQKAALEKQIADTQREERAEAVSQVRALMAQFGLTVADLGSKPAPAPKGVGGAGKVAAKYRHPETGQTWSGRGLKPNWLKAALDSGRTQADFAV